MKKILNLIIIMITVSACSTISGSVDGLKEYNKNNKTMGDGIKNVTNKFKKVK